jgi:outer membrane protein assembly factor BamC
MRRKLLAVTAVVLIALAAACSSIKSGGDTTDKSTGKLPPLAVSPELYTAQRDRPPPATSPARASLLKKSDGASVLTLNDQFDVAWRRVGVALVRVGFPIADQDQSKGVYVVRYVDPAQSEGFFSKLNPFSSKQPPKEYHVQVKNSGPVTEVNVLDKNGKEENSDTANSLLMQLYDLLK